MTEPSPQEIGWLGLMSTCWFSCFRKYGATAHTSARICYEHGCQHIVALFEFYLNSAATDDLLNQRLGAIMNAIVGRFSATKMPQRRGKTKYTIRFLAGFLMQSKPLKTTDYIPKDLIARCLAEPLDRGAWRQFFGRYQTELRAGVHQVIGYCGTGRQRDMVADCLQDAWVKILMHDRRALRAFRGNTERELKAYLRIIASSATLNRLRAAKRSVAAPHRLDSRDTNSCCANQPAIPSEEERILLMATVAQALAGELREKDRHDNLRMFDLRVHLGLSASVIAGLFQNRLTVRAVENRLSRMRKLLRERLTACQ